MKIKCSKCFNWYLSFNHEAKCPHCFNDHAKAVGLKREEFSKQVKAQWACGSPAANVGAMK